MRVAVQVSGEDINISGRRVIRGHAKSLSEPVEMNAISGL